MVSNMKRNDSNQVINHMNYDPNEYLKYAIPFQLTGVVDLDSPIKAPNLKYNIIKIPSIYKRLSKNTFLLENNQYDDFVTKLHHHYVSCVKLNIVENTHLFRNLCDGKPKVQYHLKIVDTPTYRYMFTSLKDILMQWRLYNSSWKQYSGTSITTKPMLCSPYWNGRRWKFIIVTEYALGQSLHYARTYLQKLINPYNKKNLLNLLETAITIMWILGFSHNYLHDSNILYDKKNQSIKIVDFETCIQLPDDIVNTFRRKYIQNSSQNISDIFNSTYKIPSLSLLHLSESICCKFTDTNNILQNVDHDFMHIAKDIL